MFEIVRVNAASIKSLQKNMQQINPREMVPMSAWYKLPLTERLYIFQIQSTGENVNEIDDLVRASNLGKDVEKITYQFVRYPW
jgi:hypothetical protein